MPKASCSRSTFVSFHPSDVSIKNLTASWLPPNFSCPQLGFLTDNRMAQVNKFPLGGMMLLHHHLHANHAVMQSSAFARRHAKCRFLWGFACLLQNRSFDTQLTVQVLEACVINRDCIAFHTLVQHALGVFYQPSEHAAYSGLCICSAHVPLNISLFFKKKKIK